MKIIVDKKGEIKSISEALNLCKDYSDTEQKEIFIKKGIYEEKIIISQKNIKFIGEDRNEVIITYGDFADDIHEDMDKVGTFRTYTVFVATDNFSCENLTIRNTGGDGSKVGQTVAIFSNGDMCNYVDCNFISNQDTMLLGPIPLDAKGARPVDYDSKIVIKRTYLYNCYIQGDIDFIFGSGSAVFEKCELNSNDKGKDINGYVTAASTEENNPFGFIFYKCKFTSKCAKSSVYIGRPWRKFARTVLLECELGQHIIPENWCQWNDTDNHLTTYYGQIDCYGNNYNINKLASWSYNLNLQEKEKHLELVENYKKIFKQCKIKKIEK